MTRIYKRPLPPTIRGLSGTTAAGGFIVVINADLEQAEQAQAIRHELEHIKQGDHMKAGQVDRLEMQAHRRTAAAPIQRQEVIAW